MARMRRLGLLLLAAVSVAAQAQQYRWLDEHGRVHYTDTPPPPSATSAQKKDLRGNSVGAQANFELTKALQAAPVTLYSAPQCVQLCQTARAVLNGRGIPFKEISVSDAAGLDELRQVSGGEAVPVLRVGSYVEKTPTADAYDSALDLAGYPARGTLKPRDQQAPPPPAAPAPGAGSQPPAPQASPDAESR